jgi:predicted RNA-binding protein YlqC (UPF0109 family)
LRDRPLRFTARAEPECNQYFTIGLMIDQLSSIQQMLSLIVRAIVDDPDAVSITAASRNELTVIRVRVAAGDVGQVVGRRGAVAQAIRCMVGAACRINGERIGVEFIGDKGPE